jgi:outer membrane receptor protein involved in Fe transport
MPFGTSYSTMVRAGLVAGVLTLAVATQPVQAQARTFSFDIPAETLSEALRHYGQATGQQIIFTEDLVEGRHSQALRGTFAADEALQRLLAGSGLRVERTPAGAIMIVRSDAAAEPASTGAAADEQVTIEEIIVSATKREEPVRRISGSVSAFDEAGLEALGAERFADYLTRTPGVVFNQSVPGNSAAVIRGVATTTGIAQAQGTTGYFINDVPLTDPFYSSGIPDIDTFDVDNISVLRGPQGTLFGSASLGGAIIYQAAKPDLTRLDAHVRASVKSTSGGETSYGAKAMLNVPVAAGVFGVRGVLDYRQDGGYVDNVGTGRDDANETEVRGGRLLATFAPTERTTFNYLFLQQTNDTDDAGFIEPGVGRYAKNTALDERFEYRTRIHHLRLDQEFSFATLTATAARHEKKFSGTQDFSSLLPPSLAPAAFLEPGTSEGNTFEVRLAAPTGSRFEYLVGLFHDDTDESIVNQLVAPNAAPVFGDATLLDATVSIEGEESAVFGEATWHFNEQWKATFGGRYFETRLTTNIAQSGPLIGGSSVSEGRSSESGFSPKASLTWSPDDDLLIYGLVSKGFRFGGPNLAVDPGFAIPAEFESDSLVNYEVGVRSNLDGRRLQLDGALFYIDWSDIQVTLSTPNGFTYTDNAGKARNYGFEGVATYRPSRSLTFQGNVTWLDSQLRSDFRSGTAIVPKGRTLPGAADWQIADSALYTFADSPLLPSIAFSHRYISTAPGALVPQPQEQGGYNLFDVRLSATIAGVGVSAFVENLGDERGVTQAVTNNRGQSEYVVRPRTYGMTFDYRF